MCGSQDMTDSHPSKMAYEAVYSNENDESRGRLAKVFRFLKELDQLRNPVQRDISAYPKHVPPLKNWPCHPCIQISFGDPVEAANDSEPNTDSDYLIRIKRPALTACPPPPDLLEEWLSPGWQSVDGAVDVLDSKNIVDEDEQTVTLLFTEDEERVRALKDWELLRDKWVHAERPTVEARELFERVHALWTALEREGDCVELVIADGILSVPAHSIHHPVLSQKVTLEFKPAIPEFCFSTTTEKTELNRALLRLIASVDGKMIAHFDAELENNPVEILGNESTAGFFRRLIQGLFTDGEYYERKPGKSLIPQPILYREPALILRPRTAGLSASLDNILNDLDGLDKLPPEGLLRIVGIETQKEAASGDTLGNPDKTRATLSVNTANEVLFSKAANAEQYEIANRLVQANAVLVQGPPGTGKTHTIANLLGHLLSQGKTVLVTAHTTKALRVLRGQVDEALQPLCLSVLGSDTDSQAQLSAAAQLIAERLSCSNSTALRREAGLLRDKRTKLMDLEKSLRRQLRDARFSEIDEVVFSGEGLSPIDVAKRLRETETQDGWLPAPLQKGISCPLSEQEVRDLYKTQEILTPCDEKHLAIPHPALASLVSSSDFKSLAEEQRGAASRAQMHRPEMWAENKGSGYTSDKLQNLHQRLGTAVNFLNEKETWLREALFAGWEGGDLQESWEDLLKAIQSLSDEASSAHRLIMAHGPEIPQECNLTESLIVLKAIISHLEAGGSFGLKTKLLHRDWHQLIETCLVEGHQPRTLEEFRALHAIVQLSENRRKFSSRWNRAIESIGGPAFSTLGNYPERSAQTYAEQVRRRLDWRDKVWEPLIDELMEAGFRWPEWLDTIEATPGDHGELKKRQKAVSTGLTDIIEAKAALIRKKELTSALQNQKSYLASFPQSEIASVLLESQQDWNEDHYEQACRELARLEGLAEAYDRRVTLLQKLEVCAPAWVQMITQRSKPHDQALPPGDVITAWRWRQWHQVLEERASVSIPDLQDKLNKVENELRQLAAKIIEKETWAAQQERTDLSSQQALMGFVQTIRKLGKRTGKRVPALLREARQLLGTARNAVPVWIMPLSRVYESFDPRETKFDVVIIDEASQSDVTALAALYLGREHIVVGDKEQVTPDSVGQQVDQVDKLIQTNLQGIPNSHLYDGQTSIYDLAETAFGGVVALREHFRCVPEIIQFSNHLSYNNAIRPLREPFSSPVYPALVSHRVSGFRQELKTNEIEAEEITSLILSCINDPDYSENEVGKPTSYGVISLLGEKQALLIDNKLRHHLSPDLFEKHRLLCGNAAQFQGDERDVIFLSMVDGPSGDGPLRLCDSGARDSNKKRYNVAVSRARNQLWVVHSLDPAIHLKNGDLRRRLIEHAHDPQALMRAVETQAAKTESPFEKMVLQRLMGAGYRVRPQWQVGAYRIDLVVQGLAKRLAVECDGEKWHTPDQLQQDLERQAILERLGWMFIRIRGSQFFRNPDNAMAPVFSKLQELDIEPLGELDAVLIDAQRQSQMLERVKRNAETIRSSWKTEEMKLIFMDEESIEL
jgi:very-short-patch-repair endonuclease